MCVILDMHAVAWLEEPLRTRFCVAMHTLRWSYGMATSLEELCRLSTAYPQALVCCNPLARDAWPDSRPQLTTLLHHAGPTRVLFYTPLTPRSVEAVAWAASKGLSDVVLADIEDNAQRFVFLLEQLRRKNSTSYSTPLRAIPHLTS